MNAEDSNSDKRTDDENLILQKIRKSTLLFAHIERIDESLALAVEGALSWP